MSKKEKGLLSKLPHQAKLVIAASSGLAVVIIAIVVVMTLLPRTNEGDITNENADISDEEIRKSKAIEAQLKRDSAIQQQARDALESGGVAEAQKVYADAIAGEKTSVRKVKLYLDQSIMLYGSGDINAAIAAAKEAEALMDDKFLVADFLSRIYEDQQKYALAAQYYTLAAEWADSDTNETALDKKYFDDNAARVIKMEKK